MSQECETNYGNAPHCPVGTNSSVEKIDSMFKLPRRGKRFVEMKLFFTIALIFTGLVALAQVDSISLKEKMSNLDNALLNKDEVVLNQVLHKDLSYGHSNGWVQTKADVIWDLQSGKLVYNKIENSSVIIVAINDQWATVRTNTNAEGSISGTAFQLKLHVLQVWIKTRSGWQLMARQSTKL